MRDLSVTSDIAFTASVKAIQTRKGSRRAYDGAVWRTAITPDLVALLAEQRSVFLATASADGQPYIQHRGGPPGFIKVLDQHTLAFADFRGNRQYISQGNLAENDQAHLFVIDYTHARRVKIWGRARVVEGDAALIAQLMPEGTKARPEQVILFTVEAWDINCPQHIPQRFEAEDVARVLAARDATIKALEDQIRVLHQRLESSSARAGDA